VKRAVAACTERSTISASAVAAYESRRNDSSCVDDALLATAYCGGGGLLFRLRERAGGVCPRDPFAVESAEARCLNMKNLRGMR
jgi:hypothetical protein